MLKSSNQQKCQGHSQPLIWKTCAWLSARTYVKFVHKIRTDVDIANFEEGSPAWLLWQQQKEIAEKKDSRGMRWHPLMIRWCLSIYYTSASAYKQLSSNKLSFLKLPHLSTLQKYRDFTKATSGFNADILNELMTEAKARFITEL